MCPDYPLDDDPQPTTSIGAGLAKTSCHALIILSPRLVRCISFTVSLASHLLTFASHREWRSDVKTTTIGFRDRAVCIGWSGLNDGVAGDSTTGQ